MIPKQIDRYLIQSEIGHGGMATVYLAHDPRFRRDVAVKILAIQFLDNPTFHARFEREAQMIAAIEHPAIVPVYDFGEGDGQPFLVMRYMPGGSLSDRLRRSSLSFDEATRILARLAPALDAIHTHGIVHRDLKPGNILFDRYDHAFLSDFGIARLTEATRTLTGEAIIGTPSYMSPEQVRGELDIDGRSDIYALGAILFEMLTGKHPYEATTPMGVAMKQITEPVPRIRKVKSDLPEEIEKVIEKAMAKEREERFATAREMAAYLELIAGQISQRGFAGTHGTPDVEISHPAAPEVERSDTNSIDLKPTIQGMPTEIGALPTVRGEAGAATDPTDLPAGAPPAPARKPSRWPAANGGRPGRGLTLVWIAGGLIAIAGICALLGIALAGSFTLMPGLLAKTEAPLTPVGLAAPAETVTPAKTEQAGTSAVQPSSPTPTTAVTSFQDDFAHTDSGWFVGEETGSTLYYDQGGYRILVDQPNIIAWATPDLYFTDVSIEVDATKVAGADENLFGILCRYQDEKNFYLLVIGSDGYYEVGKYIDGQYSVIEETSGYSGAIHKGRTTNRIRADCIGDTLTLYVNNLKLVKVSDDQFLDGDVGLTAAAFKIGNTNIWFDNFVARKP